MPIKPKTERNKQIIAAYEAGKTLREVAQEFDVTFQRVQQLLKQYGISPHPMYVWNSKYDHAEICSKAKAGATVLDLSIEYSVPTSYIQRILTLNNIPYIRRTVQPRRWTAECVAELYARHMQGVTIAQMATELGVKPPNISRVFARYGYKGRLGRPTPARKPHV
jgi:transposase-like protein